MSSGEISPLQRHFGIGSKRHAEPRYINNSGMALRSPLAALLTRCFAMTSRFEIRLRLPFSVTLARLSSSCPIAIAKFLAPRGRPLGFPDCPGLNRVDRGGLPKPTSKGPLLAMAPLVLNEIVEAVPCGGVDRALPGEMLPPADCGIDIKRIEFHRATDPADALGSQQRRAAAEKGVEDEIAAGRAIEDRVG